MSLIGPLLQIAAMGVGSRFWGTPDIHSDQSPFSRFQTLTWGPQPPYFAARKKCARPLTRIGK